MRYLLKSLLLIILAAYWLPLHAQEVYKTVDKNGKVHFSDTPTKNSKKVDVPQTNIAEGADTHGETTRGRGGDDDDDDVEKPIKYTLRLVSPNQGERFGPSYRTLPVNVGVEPELKDGYYIVYYFNGQATARTQSLSWSFPLSLKTRGQNTVSAAVVDSGGRILTRSRSALIYHIRP